MARRAHGKRQRRARRPRSGHSSRAPDGQVSIEMSPAESRSAEPSDSPESPPESSSESSPSPAEESPEERPRSRSRSPVTTIINRPCLVSSPRTLIGSQVVGHDVPPFRRLSGTFGHPAQQPIIVVEPQTDDSLVCDCRYCQFLSGWCCMPSFLFLLIAAVIVWLCLRNSSADEHDSDRLIEGLAVGPSSSTRDPSAGRGENFD